jgi:hypothetical protein
MRACHRFRSSSRTKSPRELDIDVHDIGVCLAFLSFISFANEITDRLAELAAEINLPPDAPRPEDIIGQERERAGRN